MTYQSAVHVYFSEEYYAEIQIIQLNKLHNEKKYIGI